MATTRKSAAKKKATAKKSTAKSTAKKTAARKIAAKKSAVKKPAVKKAPARKPAAKKSTAKKVTAKPAKKPAAKTSTAQTSRRAVPKKSAVTKQPVARKPAAPRKPNSPSIIDAPARDAPIAHISQEEAVAHIQALLEAKHERARQGPDWPGAEKQLNPANAEHAAASPLTGVSDEAAHGRIRAHERGDQSKRGSS